MNRSHVYLLVASLANVSCGSGGSGTNAPMNPTPEEQNPEQLSNLGSWPNQFTQTATSTFFTADDGVHGREIWEFTNKGETALVSDIKPGTTSTNFIWLETLESRLIFLTQETDSRYHLWTLDAGEAIELASIQLPDSSSAHPTPFLLNESLVFAFFSDNKQILYGTNGNRDGTIELGKFSIFREHFDVEQWKNGSYQVFSRQGKQKLFFEASSTDSKEIWQTDGSIEGTNIAASSIDLGSENSAAISTFASTAHDLYLITTSPDTDTSEHALNNEILWRKPQSGTLEKIVESLGSGTELFAMKRGLLIQTKVTKTGLAEKNVYYLDSSIEPNLLTSATKSSVYSYIDAYIESENEVLFSIFEEGTSTLLRFDQTQMTTSTLAVNGNQICNTTYTILKNNFVWERTEGNSSCGITDTLFHSPSGTNQLNKLLLLESAYPYNDNNAPVIGETFVDGNNIYYFTYIPRDSKSNEDSYPVSLNVINNQTMIDTQIQDRIFTPYPPLLSADKKWDNGPSFWKGRDSLFTRFDDGDIGIEPYKIEGADTTLISDINLIARD